MGTTSRYFAGVVLKNFTAAVWAVFRYTAGIIQAAFTMGAFDKQDAPYDSQRGNHNSQPCKRRQFTALTDCAADDNENTAGPEDRLVNEGMGLDIQVPQMFHKESPFTCKAACPAGVRSGTLKLLLQLFFA